MGPARVAFLILFFGECVRIVCVYEWGGGRESGLLIVQLQLQLEQRKAQRGEGAQIKNSWSCTWDGVASWQLGLRGSGNGKWENFSGLAEHGNESCSQAAVQGDGEFLREIDFKKATFLFF